MSEATQPIRPGRPNGPRTPEGKSRSAMNAMKDGFRCARMIIPAGMEEENAALIDRYESAFTPKSDAECIVFEHMVRDAWNLYRVEILLAKLADNGIDPLENSDPAVEKEHDRLSRYEARYKSSFRANMSRLEKLQTNRIGHSLLPDPVGEGSMPALAKVSEVVSLAKRTRKDWAALAINTLALRSMQEAALRERRESKPPNTPLQFRDFLTEEEKAKF